MGQLRNYVFVNIEADGNLRNCTFSNSVDCGKRAHLWSLHKVKEGLRYNKGLGIVRFRRLPS